jgi:hypothetical protein
VVVPSVPQQLAAIRHTIAKTIMPALAADADFEREQAGLVLASLDWAMDVVESEHRYEVVEHADQRALLAALLDLGPDGERAGEQVGARATLEAAASPPRDLAPLREQTRALKLAADAVYTALGGQHAARALLTRAAQRQTERELAWTRMTGFPGNVPAVADVLDRQAETG